MTPKSQTFLFFSAHFFTSFFCCWFTCLWRAKITKWQPHQVYFSNGFLKVCFFLVNLLVSVYGCTVSWFGYSGVLLRDIYISLNFGLLCGVLCLHFCVYWSIVSWLVFEISFFCVLGSCEMGDFTWFFQEVCVECVKCLICVLFLCIGSCELGFLCDLKEYVYIYKQTCVWMCSSSSSGIIISINSWYCSVDIWVFMYNLFGWL